MFLPIQFVALQRKSAVVDRHALVDVETLQVGGLCRGPDLLDGIGNRDVVRYGVVLDHSEQFTPPWAAAVSVSQLRVSACHDFPVARWRRRPPTPQIDGSATKDAPNVEVIVVGAGITGLVVAALLARAGKRVLVVEARSAGAVATGNTTAKVSLLQGSRLSAISRRHSMDLVRQYVEGNREGQAWLAQYCTERGIELQYEDAYSYAQFERGLPTARAEFEAAVSAGLGVHWVDHMDVPFEFRGGVRLAEQIQFDPMPLLGALITELHERGGRLMTGHRVYAASTSDGRVSVKLRSAQGREQIAHADHCVLATGTPILDRGGFFARLHPSRSYCVAFDVPGSLPRSMMLSVDQPTRSVRYAPPTAGGERLIVGGGGHTVGRKDSARTSYDELVGWTRRHFPGAEPTHYWSAQDYVPVDELPYVGPLLPGVDRFLVATGVREVGGNDQRCGCRAAVGQASSRWRAGTLRRPSPAGTRTNSRV